MVVDVVLDAKMALAIVTTLVRANANANHARMKTRAVDRHVHAPIAIVQLVNVQIEKYSL